METKQQGPGQRDLLLFISAKQQGKSFSTADAELFGVDTGDAMGAFGAAAADVNNDGINDLVTSSYYSEGGCRNATATKLRQRSHILRSDNSRG